MTKTPGKQRSYPYFKVQVRDGISLVWKDHRKEAFDDEEAAQEYRRALPTSVETRVVKWGRSGSVPVENK